jgi:S-adenosylmethionine synthetase
VDDAFETRQDEQNETGAADQCMMFVFACDETPEMMPMPIALAHRLTRRMAQVRNDGTCPWMRPDGKSQVTVVYEDGKPVAVDTIVISTQHDDAVTHEEIEKAMIGQVVRKVIPAELLTDETKYFINPTGRFVEGGPAADSGLTGRKLIVDTYGGYARHGGGAFSGKDASKVDRSGAYMARYMAKNIVAAGLADRCEVQLSYAIGLSVPMSVRIDTFDTARVDEAIIRSMLNAYADPRPAAIIQKFNLTAPQYSKVACYGHFGSNAAELPWEQTDIAKALQR